MGRLFRLRVADAHGAVPREEEGKAALKKDISEAINLFKLIEPVGQGLVVQINPAG
jgi:hypothetical protein